MICQGIGIPEIPPAVIILSHSNYMLRIDSAGDQCRPEKIKQHRAFAASSDAGDHLDPAVPLFPEQSIHITPR